MPATNSMALITPFRLLRSLRKNPVILQTILRSIPTSRDVYSSGNPDEWGVLEIMCHLRDYEGLFFQRLQTILHEERPRLYPLRDSVPPMSEEQRRQQDLTSVCNAFFEKRQAFLSALEEMSEEQWMREGLLDGTTPVTLKEVILQIIMHDVDHIEQITHLLNDNA